MSRTKGKRFADKDTAKELKKMKKIKKKYNEEPQATSYNSSLNYNFSQAPKKEPTVLPNSNVGSSGVNQKRPHDKKSKKPKKKRNLIFNIIIFICIVAILFSSYNIIVWFIDNYNNKKLANSIHDQVSVYEEQISIEDKQITKRFYDLKKLLSQNSDTVGWIYLNNTNIDYPVVQAKDNDFYLTHSFDKSANSAGWIFGDYRCNFTSLGENTVIYGHNRKDASMFGTLQRTLGEEWYSNEDNLYINFATLNENHVYRIFSTFVCNDTDVASYTQTSFSSQDEFKSYVNTLKNNSSHDFGTDTTDTTKIITLYTCYGLNNQRLLVCATLVD